MASLIMVWSLQKVADDGLAVGCHHRFGMKLHAADRIFGMFDGHDLAVGRLGGHAQALGQRIAHRGK